MKTLQKIRLTVSKGKIQEQVKIGGPRPVNDNVADNLLIQAEQFSPKKIEGLQFISIWEEVGPNKEEVTEKPKRQSK